MLLQNDELFVDEEDEVVEAGKVLNHINLGLATVLRLVVLDVDFVLD